MSSSSVYTGGWHNYNVDSDNDFNLILTVPQSQGSLLVAFLALFVSLAMTHLWSILCFLVHQFRSTASPRPIIYHQQQALLSNGPTAAAAAWSLIKLAWTWRGKADNVMRNSISLILTALTYLAVLAAASLLSSKVHLDGDEVLATANTCGWTGISLTQTQDATGYDTEDLIDTRSVASFWGRWTAFRSQEYVENCYASTGPVNTGMCQVYATATMPTTTNTSAECPFAAEICAQSSALEIDTGYIDSNLHFGINSPASDVLRFRKVTTCAPILAEEKYSTPWSDSLPSGDYGITALSGDSYKCYELGETVTGGNCTWVVSNYSMQGTAARFRPYGLGAVSAWVGGSLNNDTTFDPIQELTVADADVTVLYLTNSAIYTFNVSDPWFRAGNATSISADGLADLDFFTADKTTSALACTERYQFCTGSTCSSLGGVLRNATEPYWGLSLNSAQQAAFNLIQMSAQSLSINNVITFLGSEVLRANDYLWFGSGALYSSPPPSTQWVEEVTNIVNVILAGMQRLVVDFARPPSYTVTTSRGTASSLEFVKPPLTPAERSLCSNVRVRDSSYSNFSVAGMAVILVFGFLLIFINIALLPGAYFWLQRKFHRSAYTKEEWLRGRLLMLQRAALEADGIGPWQVYEDRDIPWTVGMSPDSDRVSGYTEQTRGSNYNEAIPMDAMAMTMQDK